MNKYEANNSKWKIVSKRIVSHLCNQAWISKRQIEEINASVSHWLQNPLSKLPLFTDPMRNECLFLVDHYRELHTEDKVEHRVCEPKEPYQLPLKFLFDDLPFPPPSAWDFTFIDLFAGIGGFRLVFQKAGGKCVFSSEWDKYAKQTYEANFGEYPYGDIRRIDKTEIPDHDVLCAGFPCQPFSLGV